MVLYPAARLSPAFFLCPATVYRSRSGWLGFHTASRRCSLLTFVTGSRRALQPTCLRYTVYSRTIPFHPSAYITTRTYYYSDASYLPYYTFPAGTTPRYLLLAAFIAAYRVAVVRCSCAVLVRHSFAHRTLLPFTCRCHYAHAGFATGLTPYADLPSAPSYYSASHCALLLPLLPVHHHLDVAGACYGFCISIRFVFTFLLRILRAAFGWFDACWVFPAGFGATVAYLRLFLRLRDVSYRWFELVTLTLDAVGLLPHLRRSLFMPCTTRFYSGSTTAVTPRSWLRT